MGQGCLIVIEGLDGSGKATQSRRLLNELQGRDVPAIQISFPDYESPSSTLVRMYLSGEIGGLNEVNVYAASGFYASDRYISFVNGWKKQYENGYTIIADRYSTSNAAHQMPKLPKSEWDAYLDWLSDLEFKKMCLPRPDLVIYLDMKPEISRGLIEKRSADSVAPLDIHERDFSYLTTCRDAALYAAKKQKWLVISCDDGENPRSAQEISLEIFKITQDFLNNHHEG